MKMLFVSEGTASCELEKHEAKGNITGYHRKQPMGKTVNLINARTWETMQRKGSSYNTSFPVHYLPVILVCHLQDAYVSLQDFFTGIFFGGDEL